MLLETPIPFKLVPNRSRMRFLPTLVAGHMAAMLNFESQVFTMMGKSDPNYSGGSWDFIEFENGAKAMVLAGDYDRQIGVIEQPNYYSGTMSQFALSVAISLCVSSRLSFVTRGQTQKNLVENYHKLREVAGNLPDGVEIFGYID